MKACRQPKLEIHDAADYKSAECKAPLTGTLCVVQLEWTGTNIKRNEKERW